MCIRDRFGEAPGMTDLTVTVADSLLAKAVDVRVADEQTRPARPTAQLGDCLLYTSRCV